MSTIAECTEVVGALLPSGHIAPPSLSLTRPVGWWYLDTSYHTPFDA